mgnify:CR=1 FL=1
MLRLAVHGHGGGHAGDRQAAALDAWRKTRKAVEDAKSAPAAVAVLDEAPVKQLDFESIAAGLLA